MDIALNITTAAQPMRAKPVKAREKPLLAKPLKSKIKRTQTNGFAFNFGGGEQKVKAIVARKRPTTTNKITSTAAETPKAVEVQTVNGAAKPKATAGQSNSIATPKKSIALKRKAKPVVAKTPEKDDGNSDSDLEKYARVEKQPVADDLMLNICATATAPTTAQGKPKSKMSRVERLNLKRAERRGQGPKRVFTKEEIKEGINRFTTNPNQKPRVGDLFKAQIEEEQRQKKAAEEALAAQSSVVETTPELGKVDVAARKANNFRVERPTVKKIGLFDKRDDAAMKPQGQRFVKPIKETIFEGAKVDSIGLHAHAVKNLADLLSITELTTVQQKAIPKALEGKDLLVRSQTGSGKTLAYALPVVEKLQAVRPKITRTDGVLALIIVPTRELAMQTYELMQKLIKPFTWLVPGVLMGGESRKSEKARLRKGINILIGTPGRLVDHLLHTTSFKLCKAKFLVLDEADRMLEMGYERDVKQIVDGIDKQRAELAEQTKVPAEHLQRLLLSATLTPAVQKLAGLALQEPLYIDNSEEDTSLAMRGRNGYTKEDIEAAYDELNEVEDITGVMTIPENLTLSYVIVPVKLRLVTFAALLAKEYVGKQKFKAIVFMSTMEMVNYHHDLLNEALTRKVLDEDDEELATEQSKKAVVDSDNDEDDGDDDVLLKGLRFFKLHGSMTQTERHGVFKGYRECKSGVLLATDVVGRGIDVPEVDLVIQYSPPQTTADFVHRVGRTARAGRSGRAVLFLAPSEVKFVRHLEDKRIRISQVDMDSYLQALVNADAEARNIQEAASNLQHKFQELIADDTELHDKACKAFVSWMKFYTTFPKELKPIFNIKNAHMGHFAKSFGLRDEPTSFVKQHTQPKPAPPTNRLTYTERDPEKMQQERRNKRRLYTTTVTGEQRNRQSANVAGHGGATNGALNARGGERSERSGERSHNKMLHNLGKSLALNTSEFDSGLPSLKKRRGA